MKEREIHKWIVWVMGEKFGGNTQALIKKWTHNTGQYYSKQQTERRIRQEIHNSVTAQCSTSRGTHTRHKKTRKPILRRINSIIRRRDRTKVQVARHNFPCTTPQRTHSHTWRADDTASDHGKQPWNNRQQYRGIRDKSSGLDVIKLRSGQLNCQRTYG